ncbi:alpha-galactosidase [Sporolactobacillus sp. THM19-2]|uniref:alpha-galactosidase n=1 Tax=Sporolactobacillus sp. THM19-2 TaxID=2511171 RepID=UPI0010210795|nr:alpha-galactosidase [Sporolactobacillus sp. THM19-2]RYL94100.1 alpha-galactosidase [Sporolactobacillus sp. THM19-2]
MIQYDGETMRFHLQGRGSSYVLQIVNGCLLHLYWGRRLQAARGSSPIVFTPRSFAPYHDPARRGFSLSTLPLEYPVYGNGDFRHPAYQVRLRDGSTITDLQYCSHQIYWGKKKLPGLPATYVQDDQEAETLEITLRDPVSGLAAILSYTVFRDYDAIARSVLFLNESEAPMDLLRALSVCLDFRDDRFDSLTFYGGHTYERNINRRPLAPGKWIVDSVRGASSPQHDPFFALVRPETTEDQGEAYGFSLVYSGNFSAEMEVDSYHTVRASLGINPFDFSWRLDPGESFQTPEAVLVYSVRGLGGMSRTYHDLYRSRLSRGTFRDQIRPILMNSWEAMYFKVDEEKILKLAQEAATLGIELFVLDDGWFGRRDNDRRSLGDWTVDRRKLPHGLAWLSARIHRMGLKFGLWFEPEMVSPDSELYRKHPDWCLHVPGRPRSLSRYQLILDLSREDVRDELVRSVAGVLSGAEIDYVKWDMNRHMTEIGSARLPPERQRETAHRYMLGLYAILEKLTGRFPNILFENCSSGGGRFDPGMLYYMPQTWASDNTDAISRLSIQYGTSVVYPPITTGAHVSSVPNHQVRRVTPLSTRGLVAMSGNLGYELDLGRLSDAEKLEIRRQIVFYKEIRPLIQFGTFYRIVNPFAEKDAAWCFVSPDQKQAVGFYFRVMADPSHTLRVFRFKGLDPKLFYENIVTGDVFGGDELMSSGLNVPDEKGDFKSYVWRFRKKEG